ncbi:VOC family protein [Sphingomonas histidinilytica]|uniref:Glyoxalase/Bleomycin resistance protein/Dioxygenase superfamily protein n=1 Tax=Rhizorhabdus histidinilytica TaxID=439228 RepID=A0A1T5E1B3_9SPHN|nr:VOC family protein [Rhizorhabdus histidinilytica]MBO9378017.1 VOC family protein [Rhizorhabdus histidinilytica]QEH80734.1 VOC family protein [Sphingomonas sp. C8-2]SKB77649.1 Glyoxalase/Bleomycin resistance protein/Dioxygenase superfamily protein [Rhizorhabdus histidinilytica]
MSQARFGAFDQIGFLVDDLDAAIARWMAHSGVGPWTVFRNVMLEGAYRGVPTTVGIDVALGYQDDIQIELIEATDAAASPYRAADGSRLLGLHHLARIVDDLDAAVATARAGGMVPVFAARNPSTRVAYLEVPGDPGTLFEFIEGPGLREMCDAGIAAARAWDGSAAVTVIDLAS